MVQLLLAHQADANAQDARGQTALHLAVIMGGRPGAAEVAKALLAHGADPNLEDAEGATPLTLAVKGNHTELLDLLRRHGGQE
jgi:ankyrin repeat protein